MSTLLSVVIISWNAQQHVKPCLDSVIEACGSRAVEIIVVDNGSVDDTRTILQSYGERIRLILLDKNTGVAFARNVGLKAAGGGLIWLLDVDTIVNRDAVDGMIDYLETHPECGLCACRLQSEHGDVQDSCRRLPYPEHKIKNVLSGMTKGAFMKGVHNKIERSNIKQFYRKELQGVESFEAEYVIGACQMFRKAILDEVGYLDDKIFYGPEDADFCLRIYKKGYKIICLPAYHIIHHYNRISNKKLFSRISFLHMKGLLHFYRKHLVSS